MRLKFPTAYSVLFIILIIASVLTYIIPAGKYSKLSYKNGQLVVLNPADEKSFLAPTQANLDKLGVKINIDAFTKGAISKPIAIPHTYKRIDPTPQGFLDTAQAPLKGIYDTVKVILFVLIIGGMIGVLNKIRVFNAGIQALKAKIEGKEYFMIIALVGLTALGGTTFGLSEENFAFYPILIPIFLALGYDALTCIACIFIGAGIGTMFSTVNPFATIIASNIAGINFLEGINGRLIGLVVAAIITMIYLIKYANKVKKDPKKSIIYEEMEAIRAKFKDSDDASLSFTPRLKLILTIFAATFLVLIWGVSTQGWWFLQMSTLFFISALIICFLSGLSEKECVNSFLDGAKDLLSAAFLIGIARSINLILENGNISDTILFYGSQMVSQMSNLAFVILVYLSYIVMGFFLHSSSGLAVLSMPIIAPLADSVGIGRDVIISAYQFGQGIIVMITPAGYILAVLMMVDVGYDKWLRFVFPLLCMIFVVGLCVLVGQAYF